MLGLLFGRLTAEPRRGSALYAALAAEALQPHWFVEGGVPDTLDGRFRMLATIVALAVVRLEQSGDEGDAASAALIERFIEAMEADHREMGLGDPALGRTVRTLVAALDRRVDLWRRAVAGEIEWSDALQQSAYEGAAGGRALEHGADALRRFWARLEQSELAAISQGRLE